jgi:hypothetical protein
MLWRSRDRRLEWEAYQLQRDYYQSQTNHGAYAATGPRTEFATREDLFEHLASLWANSSLLLNRLCGDKAMRYYHFLQPNQYVPSSKPMGEEEKRVAINAEHPYRQGVERGYPLLILHGQELRKKGVSFFDLTAIFKDHPEPIYIDSCCHANQAGLELMAQAIARAILN